LQCVSFPVRDAHGNTRAKLLTQRRST